MIHSKKIIIISSLLTLLLSSKIFATGAGIQAEINPGILVNNETKELGKFTGKITGTVKLSRIPMAVGFGFEAGKSASSFAYGFSGFADYWAVDLQLKNTWNFYSGFGAEGSLLTSDFKSWSCAAGARFFLGMNWLFWDNAMEFYVQQNFVPTYARSLGSGKNGSKGAFIFGLPFDAGVRFHF